MLSNATRIGPDGKPDTGAPRGSQFDWTDSSYFAQDMDGGTKGSLWDFMTYEARDLDLMMSRDHRAQTIANVLQLPIIGAKGSIRPAKGDKGECADAQNRLQTPTTEGGMETPLELVLAQMSSAVIYKRSYHEKWQAIDDAGKVYYKGIYHRPASTCRIRFDATTGQRDGFEQDRTLFIAGMAQAMKQWGSGMRVRIPAQTALIHTNAQYKDPLSGASDLEIAYWCWKTKTKIQFLLYSYLESAALPFVHVHPTTPGQDSTQATAIANQVVKLKNSGVLGTSGDIAIDSVSKTGDGATQFLDSMKYLDSCAAASVMAGFIDLASMSASRGGGSLALSKDQTDFFFQMAEGRVKELASTVTNQIIAPQTRFNFGAGAAFPVWEYEPLDEGDKEAVIAMMTAAMTAPAAPPIPQAFYDQLTVLSARILNMDETVVADDMNSAAHKALVKAAQDKLTATVPPNVAKPAAMVAAAAGQITRAKSGRNPLGG